MTCEGNVWNFKQIFEENVWMWIPCKIKDHLIDQSIRLHSDYISLFESFSTEGLLVKRNTKHP